ncbi:hypothetical protein ACI760_03020 [Capnocytophaga canimorsus]|uniref:hypothetical protein n=1 Tax=Capnocytophaga canimorsus TaxID=28188 RepID=UPI00385A106D
MKMFFNVLSGIGIFLWVIAFFVGFNYTQGSALVVSISVSLCLAIALSFLIYQLKKKSNPAAGEHRKKAKVAEYVLLGLYVVICIASILHINHAIVVTDYQVEIQGKAEKQIQELRNMIDSESIRGSYLNYVSDKAYTYNKKLEAENEDEGTRETKVEILKMTLTDGYDGLKNEIETSLDDYEQVIYNWNYILVASKLQLLQKNKLIWEEEIKKLSTQSDVTLLEPYEVTSVHNYTDLTKNIEKATFKNVLYPTGLFVLVVQILILLGYFVGKPTSSKITGYKGDGVATWN